jgi:hypothetical protein
LFSDLFNSKNLSFHCESSRCIRNQCNFKNHWIYCDCNWSGICFFSNSSDFENQVIGFLSDVARRLSAAKFHIKQNLFKKIRIPFRGASERRNECSVNFKFAVQHSLLVFLRTKNDFKNCFGIGF